MISVAEPPPSFPGSDRNPIDVSALNISPSKFSGFLNIYTQQKQYEKDYSYYSLL
jgi:hypothetical protein